MKHNIKFQVLPDLYQLLEQEAKDYDSWNKMLNRLCREYFLHLELRVEFQKLNKDQSKC